MREASVGVAKWTTLGAVLLCVASRSAPSAAQGPVGVRPGLAWAACATIAASTDARRARRRGRLGARTTQYEDERWQAEHPHHHSYDLVRPLAGESTSTSISIGRRARSN